MKTMGVKCERCGLILECERYRVTAFGCIEAGYEKERTAVEITIPCQLLDLCECCLEKVKRAFSGKFKLEQLNW